MPGWKRVVESNSITVSTDTEISYIKGSVIFKYGESFGEHSLGGFPVAVRQLGPAGSSILTQLRADLPGVTVQVSPRSFRVAMSQDDQEAAAMAAINKLEAEISASALGAFAEIDYNLIEVGQVTPRMWQFNLPPDIPLTTKACRLIYRRESESTGFTPDQKVDPNILTLSGRRVLGALFPKSDRVKAIVVEDRTSIKVLLPCPSRRGHRPKTIKLVAATIRKEAAVSA